MTVERNLPAPARAARRLLVCALLLLAQLPNAFAQTMPAGSPVLLTEGTGATTRAVAQESVTFSPEPFSVVSPMNWNADKANPDRQTRVTLFAMNLNLLPGECGRDEGPNCSIALSADAQDASGRVYPLRVESVTRPPYDIFDSVSKSHTSVPQGWLYAVTVRLDEAMTDSLGDVLVRVNLHGLSSNRARIAVGQTGGGPATDPAAEFAAPAPAATPSATPYPEPKAYGPGEASSADATRLLEQATWGPTASEVARVQALGLRAFLDEQFAAPVANPSKGSNYPDIAFPLDDSNAQCPTGSPGQADCIRDNYTMYPVQRTFYTNALYGQDQLRQRVAFALHQIFVVSGRDIVLPSRMTPYLQALDRGAFGNYRTLLQDVTLNVAMGEYLDMRQSTRTSPNENFAREILQLFSIGVNELNLDGTPKLNAQGAPIASYTQTHVDEFTRLFTGWNWQVAIAPGVTNFRDPMTPRGGTTHDYDPKTLLNGVVTPDCANTSGSVNIACAQADMTLGLNNIFNHPNVGPFVGKQLIQHLVTSNPSPAYVSRVARAFNNDCDALYADGCANARGDMKAVVRAVLLDPEARGDVKTALSYGKLREPAQYINGVLRAFNVKSFDRTSTSDGVLGTRSTVDFAGTLDQPIFQPATVFSYYQPDYEVPGAKILGPAFGILSTSTTLRRANNINTLVYTGVARTTATTDRPRGTSLDLAALESLAGEANKTDDERAANVVNALDSLLLHGTMSAQMRASVANAVKAIPTTDAAFARKRAQAAVYLVATSSQYDVQR